MSDYVITFISGLVSGAWAIVFTGPAIDRLVSVSFKKTGARKEVMLRREF